MHIISPKNAEHSHSTLCFLVLRSNIIHRNHSRTTRFRPYIEGPFIPFGCRVHLSVQSKLYIPINGKSIAPND
jgi:hypothetical protein